MIVSMDIVVEGDMYGEHLSSQFVLQTGWCLGASGCCWLQLQ
jgi:hypothetical protein